MERERRESSALRRKFITCSARANASAASSVALRKMHFHCFPHTKGQISWNRSSSWRCKFICFYSDHASLHARLHFYIYIIYVYIKKGAFLYTAKMHLQFMSCDYVVWTLLSFYFHDFEHIYDFVFFSYYFDIFIFFAYLGRARSTSRPEPAETVCDLITSRANIRLTKPHPSPKNFSLKTHAGDSRRIWIILKEFAFPLKKSAFPSRVKHLLMRKQALFLSTHNRQKKREDEHYI